MNQSFDLSRWLMLVSKHWAENRKKYTLSLIAIAGLLIVWFIFTLFMGAFRPLDSGIQITTYYFGLFLVGCLYASMLFAELASKSKGINFLSVPASTLEKLLCALFYGVVVFFITYTVIFYIVDASMLKLSNAIAYSHWESLHGAGNKFVPGKLMNVFVIPRNSHDDPNTFFYLLLAYFAVQSAFILGSVYFPKFSFIKTFISLLLVSLLFLFIAVKVIFPIMPSGGYYKDITSYRVFHMTAYPSGGTVISDDDSDKIVSLPSWINDVLITLIKYVFAPLFWIVTFFRLKEKEI
jgi:hypothetical protein